MKNKQTLSDFIEFLDVLINEEPREGQAPIENTSGICRNNDYPFCERQTISGCNTTIS